MHIISELIKDYKGPSELAIFSELLQPIGEVVIAFSKLERRLSWAIESALNLRPEDADAIQETVMSVSTRIGLFSTVSAAHVINDPKLKSELSRITKQMYKLNDYRNYILHGPWSGVSKSTNSEISGLKAKYSQLRENNKKPKQRSHSTGEMREYTVDMLDLCKDIQRWVLAVFPKAENRVP